MKPDETRVVTEELEEPFALDRGIRLFVKREDLVHPEISGNKWRKLKYNLNEARKQGFSVLLSFGGAFSNHLAAMAGAGKAYGFKTIGIVRGEMSAGNNPTLSYARKCGMVLKFVDRKSYRSKTTEEFIEMLKNEFGSFYLLPEGGSNCLAIKGCQEILTPGADYDYVCCSVGTGGTLVGLISGHKGSCEMLGFASLKGGFLTSEVKDLIHGCCFEEKNPWRIIDDYHFGGYGKFNSQLIKFINEFHKKHRILLDPIYTGKMFFGVFDLVTKNYFNRGSRIMLIHTGGLQGVKGFNHRYGNLIAPG